MRDYLTTEKPFPHIFLLGISIKLNRGEVAVFGCQNNPQLLRPSLPPPPPKKIGVWGGGYYSVLQPNQSKKFILLWAVLPII